jgi:hypothetical protein
MQWVPGFVYPGVKRLNREAEHSSPSSAQVKNGGVKTPLLHTSLGGIAYLSIGITFYLYRKQRNFVEILSGWISRKVSTEFRFTTKLIDNERQFTYGRKAAFPVFHKPCHTSF